MSFLWSNNKKCTKRRRTGPLHILEITNDVIKLTNKSPSTGFLAIKYFRKKYCDHQIILIGYTFHDLENNAYHNFKAEKNHIESMLGSDLIMA